MKTKKPRVLNYPLRIVKKKDGTVAWDDSPVKKPKQRKPRVIWVAVNESSGIIYCHGDGSKTYTEDGWRNIQFREVLPKKRGKTNGQWRKGK